MQSNKYLTFQEFETIEDANKIGEVLEANNIPVLVEKTPDLLDNLIIGRQYNNYVQLRIPPECFEDAQKLLIENTKVDLDKVDRSYMLFSLSNDELLDVVAKPDQWGAYNYNLAKLILAERNTSIDSRKVAELHNDYVNELTAQRSLDGTWYLFGYGFSIISILAIFTANIRALFLVYQFKMLPGILGMILGIILLTTKRTMPDGTQILSYNDAARRHGKAMLVLSFIAVGLAVARTIYNQNSF